MKATQYTLIWVISTSVYVPCQFLALSFAGPRPYGQPPQSALESDLFVSPLILLFVSLFLAAHLIVRGSRLPGQFIFAALGCIASVSTFVLILFMHLVCCERMH